MLVKPANNSSFSTSMFKSSRWDTAVRRIRNTLDSVKSLRGDLDRIPADLIAANRQNLQSKLFQLYEVIEKIINDLMTGIFSESAAPVFIASVFEGFLKVQRWVYTTVDKNYSEKYSELETNRKSDDLNIVEVKNKDSEKELLKLQTSTAKQRNKLMIIEKLLRMLLERDLEGSKTVNSLAERIKVALDEFNEGGAQDNGNAAQRGGSPLDEPDMVMDPSLMNFRSNIVLPTTANFLHAIEFICNRFFKPNWNGLVREIVSPIKNKIETGEELTAEDMEKHICEIFIQFSQHSYLPKVFTDYIQAFYLDIYANKIKSYVEPFKKITAKLTKRTVDQAKLCRLLLNKSDNLERKVAIEEKRKSQFDNMSAGLNEVEKIVNDVEGLASFKDSLSCFCEKVGYYLKMSLDTKHRYEQHDVTELKKLEQASKTSVHDALLSSLPSDPSARSMPRAADTLMATGFVGPGLLQQRSRQPRPIRRVSAPCAAATAATAAHVHNNHA
jgi:hypothetical protein